MTLPDRRQHRRRLPGYGVRWDADARLLRVCNELTGEWLRDPDGGLAGFTSFTKADIAWRSFQPRGQGPDRAPRI
ncbi:hypothetical protein ACWGB8_15560 [Kitasatospora sp. NPDC054939]